MTHQLTYESSPFRARRCQNANFADYEPPSTRQLPTRKPKLQALQRFAFGDLAERTTDSNLRQLLSGDPSLRARVAAALAATERRKP